MRAISFTPWSATILALGVLLSSLPRLTSSLVGQTKSKGPFNIVVPKVSMDPSIKYDYDIVYVRTPRKGNAPHSSRWADASLPLNVDADGDLMVLHPDGSEERLVAGGKGSVTDPYVSFDSEWVFYSQFEDLKDRTSLRGAAADIYKIHVKTRKVVRLTHQEFTGRYSARDGRLSQHGLGVRTATWHGARPATAHLAARLGRPLKLCQGTPIQGLLA
jgi:hypothetical protein